MNVKELSSKEIKSLISELENELALRANKEKQAIVDEFLTKANELGLDVKDLIKEISNKPKKIALAKYVNPENSTDTWTGRGRKPTWLVDLLAKGEKLENFLISNEV